MSGAKMQRNRITLDLKDVLPIIQQIDDHKEKMMENNKMLKEHSGYKAALFLEQDQYYEKR